MKKDITNQDDIKLMVDTFYDRIKLNPVLGPIFEDKIGDKWPMHLEKMYRFWATILLNEHTYSGSPFAPHATLPIDESHFKIWVETFNTTLDDLFDGEVATEAKSRGVLMAAIFSSKIAYHKENNLSS